MIQAEDFVERARELGFHWYAGVPCSFLTPFINYTIADQQLHYISSANEGDAVATCAGATLGGQRAVVMMQNSGLGNAVNPITSLAHVFRIPFLLIVTLRGDPRLKDEPQHALMGRITGELLEKMAIPWEYFPTDPREIKRALARADAHMNTQMRPYALIMRKGSVGPYALPEAQAIPKSKSILNAYSNVRRIGSERLSRAQVLRQLIDLTPQDSTVVIATTGYTGRELFALADRPNHLYMVGSLGCASSLGLGLSLVRPDLEVVIIDGDGAALMRMGNFATVGAYGGGNLVHILLDNEAHDSTGAQATVSAGVSFARIAEACGYAVALEGNSIDLLEMLFGHHQTNGPRFAHLKIRTGVEGSLPRPNLAPSAVRERLMTHISSHQQATRACHRHHA